MPTDPRNELAAIKRFDQLLAYLRDKLDWPIERIEIDELMFDYTPHELGIDDKNAAKIQEIKRLRPLSPRQPWGIFFVKFEPKRLPVVALRRILGQVVLKKRATARAAGNPLWAADDLLFISAHGDGEERRMSFAHFSIAEDKEDCPVLRVIDWSDLRTSLHVDEVARQLTTNLVWPTDAGNAEAWRKKWRSAFAVRHGEVVETSKELSIRLAALARAIRVRIMDAILIETKNGPLTKLMRAFQTSLVHDLDADGFADMYAQTIAYGLLSARITNPKANTADGLMTQIPVTNPFLKELMETFLNVGGRKVRTGRGAGIDFDELGVSEVVELLDDANMEAVVRDFGDKNPQEDPVIHFYELFLKEYDSKKRMQRGVFYTPRPVVSYIVRSVDELLRTDFGLSDGLADTTTWREMAKRHADLKIPDGVSPEQAFVQILDPATGTGTFLVEVIDLIYKSLVDKWKAQRHGPDAIDALWNEYVPKHLLPRLHGYELLMAPYAIAHLKIGLKLYETRYRFGSDERARVYLTNALEPPFELDKSTAASLYEALGHESQAVNDVKRHQRFSVVIGNPPYAGYSANDGDWMRHLMEQYKTSVRGEERQIQRLSNDYVKFVRLGESILCSSGAGLLGLITDNGYLNGVLFRDMRTSLRSTFPEAWIYNLHGVAMRGADRHGAIDENVFDITQGVAIGLYVRAPSSVSKSLVHYAALLGTRDSKYAALALGSVNQCAWTTLTPRPPQFLLVPAASDREYESWPLLTEIAGTGSPKNDRDSRYGTGVKTRHDEFVVGWTPDDAVARVKRIANRAESDGDLMRELALCTTAHFSIRAARKRAEAGDLHRQVRLIAYRPFDSRALVYLREFVCEPKTETMKHMLHTENCALAVLRRDRKEHGSGYFVARGLIAKDFVSNLDDALVWPLYLYATDDDLISRTARADSAAANLSGAVVQRVGKMLGCSWLPLGGGDLQKTFGPADIFHYMYAILYSPGYRARYAELLRLDFPHFPITPIKAVFRQLARIGGELVALHLVEAPSQAALSACFDSGARRWRLDITNRVRLPVTLSFNGPEAPVVDKVGWSDNTVWIDAVRPNRDSADDELRGAIGFRGVPEDVWKFHIGGYQVCEKWLKDRKGRRLTADDITHYLRIVVALSETIRLMREIDDVIDAHGGWPTAFRTADAAQESIDHALKVAEPRAEYGSVEGEDQR